MEWFIRNDFIRSWSAQYILKSRRRRDLLPEIFLKAKFIGVSWQDNKIGVSNSFNLRSTIIIRFFKLSNSTDTKLEKKLKQPR